MKVLKKIKPSLREKIVLFFLLKKSLNKKIKLAEQDIAEVIYIINKAPHYLLDYIEFWRGPRKIIKEALLKSGNISMILIYTMFILKYRWKEAEKIIRESDFYWKEYQAFLNKLQSHENI